MQVPVLQAPHGFVLVVRQVTVAYLTTAAYGTMQCGLALDLSL